MKPRAKAGAVAAGALMAALLTGGVASAADWFVVAPQSKIKNLQTVAMPGFDSGPAVEVNAKTNTVAVRWVVQKVVKGERVQRYIVRRYNTATGSKHLVCGAEVVTATCKDTDVPTGSWAYTVQTAQYRWTGPESPRSGVVTIEPEPKAAAPEPVPTATTATETPSATRATVVATTAAAPAPTPSTDPPAIDPAPPVPSEEHTEP